jgi:hypothetical protein
MPRRELMRDESDSGETQTCPTCGESFGSMEELRAHQRQTHADELTPETPGQLTESE